MKAARIRILLFGVASLAGFSRAEAVEDESLMMAPFTIEVKRPKVGNGSLRPQPVVLPIYIEGLGRRWIRRRSISWRMRANRQRPIVVKTEQPEFFRTPESGRYVIFLPAGTTEKKRSNPALEPTAMDVTPPSEQEPRRP